MHVSASDDLMRELQEALSCGLPVTCLLLVGASCVILGFVGVYGNWTSFEYYANSSRPPYSFCLRGVDAVTLKAPPTVETRLLAFFLL